MINFNVRYHNVNLDNVQKKLQINTNITNEINKVFANSSSLTIVKKTKDLSEIEQSANLLINKKGIIFVLGIGGSNLGARALVNILQENKNKKIIFIDNIDPIKFRETVMNFDMQKTGFIIISKSGHTPETLSQFLSIIEFFNLNNFNEELFRDFIVITEDKKSPLNQIANEFSCQILNHDKNIGGRYSVFSNAGLLPAYIAGVNISKIRLGASEILSKAESGLFKEHLIGAHLILDLQTNQSINLNVLMTYADTLYYFGKWYLQLWAESIGKDSKGLTPIHSIGTTDQHSQLQLYLDGPRDKFFTLITTDYRGQGLKMNEKILKDNDANFLAGKTMGDLMYAEQQATLNILVEKGLPIREIFCNQIDEFTIGQLMAYFMMETITTCHLIGVDPFNQPAVERGKKLAKDYLSEMRS